MEDKIQKLETQYKSVKAQNEYLKNKNITLIEELENINKKKEVTTNDSSGHINIRGDVINDPSSFMDGYLSPLEQPKK